MCGIAGILNFNDGPANEDRIRQMTGAMSHRGPDADGILIEGPLALGHRRLAIIDLSAASNQPFADNSGRYVMVFNGEMYNFQEVKSTIHDYHFKTTSDTEVLIAAYARWGPDCIGRFRGMFTFAIWDRQEKELFIARDRMGVKPLYYHIDKDKLLFASEIRAILAGGQVKRQLDPSALLDYFSYQSVSSPTSPIEGILQLEAGTWMKIKAGQQEKKVYWDVTTARTTDFDFSDRQRVQQKIRDLTLQAVGRRLVSDVPVGAFLSGGIDSSVVVGLMAEAGSSRPNTFNVSFDEKEFDESYYAELIAKKFNTQHTRLLMKPTVFLDELQNALDAMDTPSGDGINSYVVSKAIRRNGMTVALSGVGGDELFAGYPFFAQYLQLQRIKGWWSLPAGLRRLLANAWAGRQAQGKKARMKQLLELPSMSIDHSYPVFRQILSPQLIRQLTFLADNQGSTTVGQELSARAGLLQRLPLLSQVSAAEYLGYTQHTLLKDTDQMSMAVSLEVREPFFDQDLVEFVLSVPDVLKRPVYPKSLLVESLKPLLPDEVVHRKKQGFLFPWKHWLKNELRGFCDTQIRNMARRPFIKEEALLSYWQRFLSGDETVRWPEVWLFVVLEYWLEKNKVDH
jgi:asparagine synthase (glutamine-hydrolysing)